MQHGRVKVNANTNRPLFGTHASVAGGLPLAIDRAVALGCESVQLFTRNPNRWQAPALDARTVRDFRARLERTGLPAFSHASYLVNLASGAEVLLAQSVTALADEIERASRLGLRGVVLHPGTRCGADSDDDALDRIAASLRVVLDATRGGAMVLLEHTAGQGASVGHAFAHLAGLVARLDGDARVGVCLDTCHLLASGYDIASPDGYRRTFAEFGRLVGFGRLQAFHVNDSRKPCGSRVDRHAHIGEGFIGLDGFRRLVRDRRFRRMPMMLETEKHPVKRVSSVEPDPLDRANLARLRALLAG